MTYSVHLIHPEEWKKRSEFAHFATFGEFRPRDMERIDYALIAAKESDPIGYVQCIEMDAETIYWQLGGAHPDYQKRIEVIPGFIALMDWCLNKYKRIKCRVHNENISMIKLKIRMGFLIIGTQTVNNKIYVEFLKEGDRWLLE